MSFVTVSSRLGLENQPTPSGSLQELRGSGSEWGIDGTGPYLSPSGAAVNENAVLSLDPDGVPVLTIRTDDAGDVFLVRRDGRLHPSVRDRVVLVGSDGARQQHHARRPDGRLLPDAPAPAVKARAYPQQHATPPLAVVEVRAYRRTPDGHLQPQNRSEPTRVRVYPDTTPTPAPGVQQRGYDRDPDGRLHPAIEPRTAPARVYRQPPPPKPTHGATARIYPRHTTTPSQPVERTYQRDETGRTMPHPPIHAERTRP